MSQHAPTTLFLDGNIITLEARQPRAEAFAVSGDRIVAVGSSRELLGLKGPETLVVDLKGKTVLPGFNDSHMHLLYWGMAMESVDLASASSAQDLIALGRRFHDSNPDADWIVGRGWSDELFQDKQVPTKCHLDAISSHRPVVFTRVCGHICVVNSRALELAGIGKDTADPAGGEIDRDPTTGEPTGVLRETAMEMVRSLIPKPTVADTKRAILRAARKAASYGLTSVQTNDIDGVESMQVRLDAYKELAESSELPIRVNLQVAMPTPKNLSMYLNIKKDYENVGPNLSLGPLKLFADGSLGAKTAALNEPYADDPGNVGIAIYSQSELDELVLSACEAGMQVAVHAIGDRAMEMVLNSYERAQGQCSNALRRPRIIHCQITAESTLARMAKLDVVADIQPIFVPTDLHFVESRVGYDRSQTSYAWRTMLELGIHVAAGSDCPVESADPMLGIRAAVTRQDGAAYPDGGWNSHEKLSLDQALRVFTTGPAYASFDEDRKGTLAPGKLADFVVLPFDPYDSSPARLSELKVLATYVGGQKVY